MTVAVALSLRRLLAYDPNKVKPGWIAFFVVMVLVVATFLLWRSMNTQLGRIKAPHEADLRRARKEAASGTTSASPADEPAAADESTPDQDPLEDPDTPR